MIKASYLVALIGFAVAVYGCSGDYDIEDESDLEAIAHVESIEGCLVADYEDWLTSIDLPALSSVGDDLYISYNTALTSIDMPALTTVVDMLFIHDNAALTSLDMSALTTVGGPMKLNDTTLTSLDGLSSLTSVGIYSTAYDGSLCIHGNACLSQDEAEAFAAGLDVVGHVTVSQNGEDYPCD